MAHYLELDGEFVSAKEYCKRKGLNYNTVKSRMKSHDETYEQSIHYYEETGIRDSLIHLGSGEVVSRKEYCKLKGLKYTTVIKRMKNHNETFEQAIKYYEENGVRNYLIDYGNEKITQKEYCNKKGFNYHTVLQRMKSHNETFEQSIHYYENNELRRPKGTIKDTRFYAIWKEMIDRCTNSKNPSFEKYSKLGIQESWLDFETFQNDMYEEYLICPHNPNDLPSIDRKDNAIGYFKENCHWIPRSKQNRNKDNNVWVNEDELLIEYCERKGLRYSTIQSRIKLGYTLEEAESMPIPKYNGKNLKYIGKNIREFKVLDLSKVTTNYAIAKCNICNAEIKFCIPDVLNHKPNKGCSCRRGHKFYIGDNNYTYKELETLYNLSHKEMKKVIDSGDNEFFKNIENLSYDEWIELLKDIHNRW